MGRCLYAMLYASVRGTQTPRHLTVSKVLKVLTDDQSHVLPRQTTNNRHGVSIPEHPVAGRGVARRPQWLWCSAVVAGRATDENK